MWAHGEPKPLPRERRKQGTRHKRGLGIGSSPCAMTTRTLRSSIGLIPKIQGRPHSKPSSESQMACQGCLGGRHTAWLAALVRASGIVLVMRAQTSNAQIAHAGSVDSKSSHPPKAPCLTSQPVRSAQTKQQYLPCGYPGKENVLSVTLCVATWPDPGRDPVENQIVMNVCMRFIFFVILKFCLRG